MPNASVMERVFREAGLPEHVIHGIIANGIFESGGGNDINTGNQTGDDGTAWGGFQWREARRQSLMDFAEKQGRPWTDPEVQARFVLYELETGQGGNDGVLDALLRTDDAGEAARVFMEEYERPGTPHTDQRVGIANQLAEHGVMAFYETGPRGGASAAAAAMGQGGDGRGLGLINQDSDVMQRWQAFRQGQQNGEVPIISAIRDRLVARRGGFTPFLDRIEDAILRFRERRGDRQEARAEDRATREAQYAEYRNPPAPGDRPTTGVGFGGNRPAVSDDVTVGQLEPAKPAIAGPATADAGAMAPGMRPNAPQIASALDVGRVRGMSNAGPGELAQGARPNAVQLLQQLGGRVSGPASPDTGAIAPGARPQTTTDLRQLLGGGSGPSTPVPIGPQARPDVQQLLQLLGGDRPQPQAAQPTPVEELINQRAQPVPPNMTPPGGQTIPHSAGPEKPSAVKASFQQAAQDAMRAAQDYLNFDPATAASALPPAPSMNTQPLSRPKSNMPAPAFSAPRGATPSLMPIRGPSTPDPRATRPDNVMSLLDQMGPGNLSSPFANPQAIATADKRAGNAATPPMVPQRNAAAEIAKRTPSILQSNQDMQNRWAKDDATRNAGGGFSLKINPATGRSVPQGGLPGRSAGSAPGSTSVDWKRKLLEALL